jgi:hypothetical protein
MSSVLDNELTALITLIVRNAPDQVGLPLSFPKLQFLSIPTTAAFLLESMIIPELSMLQLRRFTRAGDNEGIPEEIWVRLGQIASSNHFPSSIKELDL